MIKKADEILILYHNPFLSGGENVYLLLTILTLLKFYLTFIFSRVCSYSVRKWTSLILAQSAQFYFWIINFNQKSKSVENV